MDTEFKQLFDDHPERTDNSIPFRNDELGFLGKNSRESFYTVQYAYAPKDEWSRITLIEIRKRITDMLRRRKLLVETGGKPIKSSLW